MKNNNNCHNNKLPTFQNIPQQLQCVEQLAVHCIVPLHACTCTEKQQDVFTVQSDMKPLEIPGREQNSKG